MPLWTFRGGGGGTVQDALMLVGEPTATRGELMQVCLPVLRAGWVREVRPLPGSPEEVTDWSARA